MEKRTGGNHASEARVAPSRGALSWNAPSRDSPGRWAPPPGRDGLRRGTPYRGATRARDQVQWVERRKRDNLSDRYQDGWIGKEDRDGILLNAVDRDGTKMYSDSEEEYPHMTSSKVGRNSHKTEKNQKGN